MLLLRVPVMVVLLLIWPPVTGADAAWHPRRSARRPLQQQEEGSSADTPLSPFLSLLPARCKIMFELVRQTGRQAHAQQRLS